MPAGTKTEVQTYKMFVNGELVGSKSERRFLFTILRRKKSSRKFRRRTRRMWIARSRRRRPHLKKAHGPRPRRRSAGAS